MPALTRINLRFAGQLKDPVVRYLLDRRLPIRHLQLDAANLISHAAWVDLFAALATQLESLKLANLNGGAFSDRTVEALVRHCPNLRRLKLTECWDLHDDSLRAIASLPHLEHLTLHFLDDTDPDALLDLVRLRGSQLQTLALTGFHRADDTLLAAIHTHCRHLRKLRLADNACCTDRGYAALFARWSNPPLAELDLSTTRDIDNANPDGPAEPVGLAAAGLAAALRHSGSALQVLRLASCRHVSHAALENGFAADPPRTYPQLRHLDLSFVPALDDFLTTAIFRSCPALRSLVAFGCFHVRDVRVPAGVALIGGLRAQDSIIVEGGGD
jgi:DNA repair protein RAD7